jgi:hypothetical protein
VSATIDFYLIRAAECARDAQATNLVNVRERALRAEAAWRTMATRLIQIEEQKTRDALVKTVATSQETANVPWPIAPIKANAKRDD